MKLDYRQTDALLAVIETGSFEEAATRLNVTASAISQRIRALETRLGQPLVVRSRPCRSTAHGQRLLQYLRRTAWLEEDMAAEMAAEAQAPLVMSLALNADSLGTWFVPTLAEVLIREHVLLDVTVEDQDHTYALMEAGMALACITTEAQPMRGCQAEWLGSMRYRMAATPAFAARYFANGLNRDSARHAPVMVYNRKDALQADFLQNHLGLPRSAYPCHYLPSHESYYAAIRHGLGYGLLPDLQMGDALARGDLIDLAPAWPVDLQLYWHAWKVQSPRLESITRQILQAARAVLGGQPQAEAAPSV
ncbi:Chromosome initiation inhibitor [Amantichitinum ursilacus]|uniref:Chromosome initiation inhibitor n=2 Tax=Amantichitinum ursilacus TaxID=857265 RepID=A0A0N0XG55_9NEIS|nr:Chromosome initiation inhibitor [Amantichitinum ursilacus]